MYVAAGVAAATVFHLDTEILVVGGRHRTLVLEHGGRVDTAGTADKHFRIVLRVKVKEDFAVNHILAEIEGTGHACLLVDSDEHFKRSVHEGVVDKSGE